MFAKKDVRMIEKLRLVGWIFVYIVLIAVYTVVIWASVGGEDEHVEVAPCPTIETSTERMCK